jgi:hypothetical protein
MDGKNYFWPANPTIDADTLKQGSPPPFNIRNVRHALDFAALRSCWQANTGAPRGRGASKSFSLRPKSLIYSDQYESQAAK